MKPGGYSDSGADIAYSLYTHQYPLITPTANPSINNDYDWVFPDTYEGILTALKLGAKTFWLNTVLYRGHPIEQFQTSGLEIVGQKTIHTDSYDDKWYTNQFLIENGLPIPASKLVSLSDHADALVDLSFPLVIKPILGRGSQGVTVVRSHPDLIRTLNKMFKENAFGDSLYLEEFLSGKEVTFTVMPPGGYQIGKKEIQKKKYWSLPAVVRFNHLDGIAPYNGVVAVVENSEVLSDEELISTNIQKVSEQCEKAASLINVKAPIRIDCRADELGTFYLFDLNMKPNMTGPSRPHRQNQDSLTMIAARKIGWNYADLIANMLAQRWEFNNTNSA